MNTADDKRITKISSDDKNWCEIDILGCNIQKLFLNNNQILWSGNVESGDYACTHPCIPNFYQAKDLPNHGPARNELWQQVGDNTFTWQMSKPIKYYQAGLKAERLITVSKSSLSCSTAIVNKSNQRLPINIAEHCYFPCSAVDKPNITINGHVFGQKAANDQTQFIAAKENNVLHIPGIGDIIMELENYTVFALWSMPEEHFACIEPIQLQPPDPERFSSDAHIIEMGEEIKFRYSLSL